MPLQKRLGDCATHRQMLTISAMSIAKTAAKNLLAVARAYAKATGKTLPTVAREVYGRAGFFDDLKSGRQSVTLTNLDVLLKKFGKLWPEGTPWPTTQPITMAMPLGKNIPKENRPAL